MFLLDPCVNCSQTCYAITKCYHPCNRDAQFLACQLLLSGLESSCLMQVFLGLQLAVLFVAGIVRYRVGRPSKLPFRQQNGGGLPDEDFMRTTFTEVCSWQWLTLARGNADWKYEVLIQVRNQKYSSNACIIKSIYNFCFWFKTKDQWRKYFFILLHVHTITALFDMKPHAFAALFIE